MILDKKFQTIDFSFEKLEDDEYENCVFIDCKFSQHSLSNIIFRECEFDTCDFGKALLNNTEFNDVHLKNCRLLGIDFSVCSTMLLSPTFSECNLSFASFYKLKLKEVVFTKCKMKGADFTETNLTKAILDCCDLKGAVFEHSILEKADFRTALHYNIDPEINKVKKTKFSILGLTGLLNKYDIVIE